MSVQEDKTLLEAFGRSVDEGLSSKRRSLSSRYFYDDEGSRIFQQIMEMDEYYLTNAEFEILDEQASKISQALSFSKPYNIVELGAGDGKKTIRLLHYLQEAGIDFTYMPIDISQEAITMLQANINEVNREIKVVPMVGDYFDMLDQLRDEEKSTFLLFLGSNLGNFRLDDAQDFIQALHNKLKRGDKLLLGLDLQKNPHTIRNAYNDEGGITRAFNLNLLKRINRELAGNFNLQQWEFYSTYDPVNGEVRSFLISLEDHDVLISKLGKSFHFDKNELIYTELSRKYTLNEVEELAQKTGFKDVRHFQDSNLLFTDSLMTRG